MGRHYNMKIGLTGPTSTGKTTTMNIVAKDLNLDIHQITTRDIFDKYNITSQIETINTAHQFPEKYYNLYKDLIKGRHDLFINKSDLITDRLPIDSLIYYKLQHLQFEQNAEAVISEFNKLCLDTCKSFDMIFVFPPVRSLCVADGVRHVNFEFNKLYYQVLLDAISEFQLYNVAFIPEDLVDINRRVKFIKQVLENASL